MGNVEVAEPKLDLNVAVGSPIVDMKVAEPKIDINIPTPTLNFEVEDMNNKSKIVVNPNIDCYVPLSIDRPKDITVSDAQTKTNPAVNFTPSQNPKTPKPQISVV